MRLTKTMKSALFTLIVKDLKIKLYSSKELTDAFIEAVKAFNKNNDEIVKFLDKYPQYRCRCPHSMYFRTKDLFTSEELETIVGNPTCQFYTEGEIPKNLYCMTDDEIFAWFKRKYNPKAIQKFVSMIKEHAINVETICKFKEDLNFFLEKCTTDKQILETYPHLEKYFNEAGIIPQSAGKALPVPVSLTRIINNNL